MCSILLRQTHLTDNCKKLEILLDPEMEHARWMQLVVQKTFEITPTIGDRYTLNGMETTYFETNQDLKDAVRTLSIRVENEESLLKRFVELSFTMR